MFESTLIASRKSREGRAKLVTLPVAVALHVLAVAVFFVAQLFAIDAVPEPYLSASMIVVQVPAPPPAAKGNPAGRTESAKPAAIAMRNRLVQPREVAPLSPVRREQPAEDKQNTVVGGDPFADGSGSSTDVDYGDPNSNESGEQSMVTEETPYIVGGAIVPPETLYRVDPVYPDIARLAKVQGPVIVQATIDTSGNVVDAVVLRGIRFGCDEAALTAIRQWKYRPATLNDRKVPVYLTVTFNFVLNHA